MKRVLAEPKTWRLHKTQDGNLGLVEELVEQQNRAYVSRLSRTFSAIPMSNIASNVGSEVEQVTAFVETLIQNGLLNARRDALGAEMRGINADIERYEKMRGELMELSELNHELEQQLDSELAPPAPAPVETV